MVQSQNHFQDLLLMMRCYRHRANSPGELLPEETPFADADLSLKRVKESATFPQLGMPAWACGHGREPLSAHGACEELAVELLLVPSLN